MRKYQFVLAILLTLALAIMPALAQDEGGTTIVGGDDIEALRTFVERMYGPYGPYSIETTLYIALLPDDLDVSLPLPEDASLIGSMVTDDGYSNQTQVVFDTALPVAEVESFYKEGAGEMWTAVDQGYQPTGFVEQMQVYGVLCYNGDEAVMDFNAHDRNGTTEVRLFFRTPGDPYLCGEDGQRSEPYYPDPYRMMPLVNAPEGVNIRPGSTGGGGGGMPGMTSSASSAILDTELALADFFPAYNSQIEAAGWTNIMNTVNEGVAASTWTLTDEEGKAWELTFTVTASPAESNTYLANLYLRESAEAE